MSTNKNDYYHLGLTDDEVLQSREKNGINLLTPPKRPSLWKLYLEKFEDPVVRVLLVAAVFSLIISIIENEYAETIGIIAAILLATGIGFFFEYDASKKFDLLNAVNEETLVKVIRNGRVQEIPRKDIVVGDIVILETGEEIPADGELLEAISLQVNESNLTGEPVINKTTVEADFDEEATYASNLVMRGTTVVDGHGTMRVLHVGDATEIGKVARQSTEDNLEPTPLNIQLTKLANLIGKIGFTVAGLAFLIFFVKDVLLFFDFGSLNGWHEWLPVFERTLKYFMMAVTLIVVAVPEGLPMSVTLSLALNMRRMLSTNNLVRKMHACETMGAITVICTDMLNGDDHYAYVVGYSDGTVRPNANISRAEVATIFFRLLKKEVRDGNLTTENIFADVTNGQWHNKAISTMAKLGIVKGRRADSFDPDASITRAEFAAICARFNTKPVENSGSFSDISGHWAENEIERAAAFGWISGYPDGTFRPDARITRAEAMTMINRVLCRMPQSESDLLDSMVTWPDNKPSDWHYLAVQEATNSHDFNRQGEVGESWTKLTSVPDWTRYQ